MTAPEDRIGFIAGGTWCADHNKLVDRWPGEEEPVLILDREVRGGGPACNLAVGVKRLDPDMPVATIGLLGDDADGRGRFCPRPGKARGEAGEGRARRARRKGHRGTSPDVQL